MPLESKRKRDEFESEKDREKTCPPTKKLKPDSFFNRVVANRAPSNGRRKNGKKARKVKPVLRYGDPVPALYPYPIKSKSRGKFNLTFLFDQKGQVYVESVGDQDDLNLVPLLVERFNDVLSPPDVNSKVSENGTPIKETRTPRKRQFKHLLLVTVKVRGLVSVLAFYQVPNSQALLKRRPPVYHDTSRLPPVTPPKEDKKTVSGRVTLSGIKRNRRKKRRNPSGFYHRNSANDLSQNGERNAYSHLLPVRQIGEHGREATVAATEGQNITQMAFENAIDKALRNLRGEVDILYAYAEATLQRDKNGKLTHIGRKQTLSYATSPGESTAVIAETNSDDPNRATCKLAELVNRIVLIGLFSAVDDKAPKDDETPIPPILLPRRLDFGSL